MRTRLSHIDNAKAIGMMLIVASHVIPSKGVTDGLFYQIWDGLLNSFYVPLFFILSGVFEPSATDYKKFGKRLLKLGKYCLIFHVFGIVADGLINSHWSLTSYPHLTAIWFLFVLLWITAIVGVLKNIKFNYLIYIVLIGGGIWASHNSHSYMFLGQSCLCLPFYLFGYYAKDFLKNVEFRWPVAMIALIFWITTFILFYKSQNVGINLVNQNYIAFYVEAVSGSLFVIELCKLFSTKFFSYYGENTIVPMMTQFALIWLLTKFANVDSMWMYYFVAILSILFTFVTIPAFKNKKYNIFK